jgi:hypothetical protein
MLPRLLGGLPEVLFADPTLSPTLDPPTNQTRIGPDSLPDPIPTNQSKAIAISVAVKVTLQKNAVHPLTL